MAFLLMLHQGLRRGELLLLNADVFKSAFDERQKRSRCWLNVQESQYSDEDDDPRYSRPSIKSASSVRQCRSVTRLLGWSKPMSKTTEGSQITRSC